MTPQDPSSHVTFGSTLERVMVQLAVNELSDTMLETAVKLTFHGFAIGYDVDWCRALEKSPRLMSRTHSCSLIRSGSQDHIQRLHIRTIRAVHSGPVNGQANQGWVRCILRQDRIPPVGVALAC